MCAAHRLAVADVPYRFSGGFHRPWLRGFCSSGKTWVGTPVVIEGVAVELDAQPWPIRDGELPVDRCQWIGRQRRLPQMMEDFTQNGDLSVLEGVGRL